MGMSKAMVFGQRGVVMMLGVVMLATTLFQVDQAGVSAATTTINFDDVTARESFISTKSLTDQYKALGVTFSGPSVGTGGAILNYSSGFIVTGSSLPNFLAFNVNEVYAIGPETITFADPVQRVSINAGSTDDGLVVLAAYDGATMLGVDATGLSATMTTLEVEFERITHVMIVFTSPTLVLDDLTWTSGNSPTIAVPADMVVPNDAGQAGAVVTYEASASDDEDGPLTPVCSPPSGAFFPLGPTTVTCGVTDSDGDSGSASFTVTVLDAQELLALLRADTIELVTNSMTERALLQSLDKAQTALSTGNTLRAYGALLEYRVQLTYYERLGRISPDVAAPLQARARQVMDAIVR